MIVKHRNVWYFLLACLALAAPAFVYPMLLVNIVCFALVACGYNLLIGYTKSISFGHSAYIGSSAYLTGYLLASMHWPTELGLLAGVLGAMALGYAFGVLAIRSQGLYFGMVTLAQSQLVYFFFLNAPFTGGENGLQNVPRGRLAGVLDLSNDLVLYYFVLAMFVMSFLFIYRVVHSPFGHILKAIRENEERATSLGYDSARFKLIVFVLSAGLTGLAGSLKTLSFGIASLSDVHWSAAGELLVMVLVGGIGTVWGPVVGAGIVVFLQHYLAERAPSLVLGVMGVVFVVCVLTFRRGIVGEMAARLGVGESRRVR
jgi:branched-chain amino acid transport system permease protein